MRSMLAQHALTCCALSSLWFGASLALTADQDTETSDLVKRQYMDESSVTSYTVWQLQEDGGGTAFHNFTYLPVIQDPKDPKYYPPSFSPVVIKTYGRAREMNVSSGPDPSGSIGHLSQYLCDDDQWTVVSSLPDYSADGTGQDSKIGWCPDGPCSTQKQCTPIYNCLYTNPYLQACDERGFYQWGTEFDRCMSKYYPHLNTARARLQCPLAFIDHTKVTTQVPDAGSIRLASTFYDCSASIWNLASGSWSRANVSENIETFINGGADTYGAWWVGLNFTGQLFLDAMGLQLLGLGGLSCDLESPCNVPISCTNVGSRSNFGRNKPVLPSLWGYFVLVSLENISRQFTNQYQALQTAATKATLTTFNINDFYPSPSQQIGLQNFLTGLGGLLALVGGFIPGPVGPTFGKASTIIGTAGGFLGRTIAAQTPANLQQSVFASQLQSIFGTFEIALDSAANILFNGTSLPGEEGAPFTIFDMMDNGAFIDQQVLAPLVNLTEFLRVEVISRSINALWKTPSDNKMWVSYLSLQDPDGSKCAKHTNGPQESKYCADDGVYYAYNFQETGDYRGILAYPWGADKLSDIGLDFKAVTEASAKTYTTLKRLNYDPFNFTDAALNDAIVNSAYLTGIGELTNTAGRLPSSWTLPVCNMSTWGDRWNFDYVHEHQTQPGWGIANVGNTRGTKFPPCLCGDLGTETAAWAKAANLENFQTFYQRCSDDLLKYGFKWPDGVQNVSYGFGDIIKRPK